LALQEKTKAVDRIDIEWVAYCDHQPALAKGHWDYFETPRVFAPDLVNDVWRNDHRGDVNPIHVRLCSQRARDVHLGQSSVADQNVEDTGLAVQTQARAIDLMPREEPSLLENSKHILFVVLHRGKNAAVTLAETGFISSSC